MSSTQSQPSRRAAWLAAYGALCAAVAIGLSAYAAHGAEGLAQSRLQTAAVFAFGHGVALAALARETRRTLARVAFAALSLGVFLFSGSLVLNVLAQWPTTLAPLGGMLLIAGWVMYAIDRLRR
ncbi:MAG TPA: DUF423 domain-containing protein [Luteimonas sp.]|nr:DUF423 domain-containing protein [Luteimonas sp.]